MTVALFSLLVLLLSGCAGLVQKGGEALEGSAFAEKTFAVYRSAGKGREPIIELKELKFKNGEEILEISGSAWPGLALRGSMPDGNGSFHLTEARILSPHVHGWNEFTLDLLGNASFSAFGKTGGVLRIGGEPERVQISSGDIRLKSSRLTGTAAVAALRNRRERILALTEWMGERQRLHHDTPVFADPGEFDAYWKRRLFPELAAKKNRLQEYSTENAEWRRADGVRWNLTYTEYLLSEELWELRNSGALLRDWEEALAWIFMEYSWNRIIDSFNETALHKVK